MMTAAEARRLAGQTVQEKVNDLLLAVEELAKQKHRVLKTGWDYTKDADLWVHGGYNNSKEWVEAKKILEGLGYKVNFFYKESQFVDMYTLIEW